MPEGVRRAMRSSTVDELRTLATGAANPIEETRRQLRESHALLLRLQRSIAAAKRLTGGDPPEHASDAS